MDADRAQAWRLRADGWLHRMEHGREWTNDNLWVEIGNPGTEANENNSVGGWVSAQSKAKRIVWTGRMVPSKRASRHGNLIRVWRKA